MIDNIPGAPPPNEEIKPKSPNVNQLTFSFQDLSFDNAFSIEDEQYLRYFVDKGENENSYFIDVPKDIYIDYFIFYTDLFEDAVSNDKCSCDITTIDQNSFEEVDEIQIIIEGEDLNTKEQIKIEEKYKVYLVFDLTTNLKISLHDSHNLYIKNND